VLSEQRSRRLVWACYRPSCVPKSINSSQPRIPGAGHKSMKFLHVPVSGRRKLLVSPPGRAETIFIRFACRSNGMAYIIPSVCTVLHCARPIQMKSSCARRGEPSAFAFEPAQSEHVPRICPAPTDSHTHGIMMMGKFSYANRYPADCCCWINTSSLWMLLDCELR